MLFITYSFATMFVFAAAPSEFTNPFARVFLCVGFLFWAYIYLASTESRLKIAFGLFKVGAALWSDWYQVGKIANEGWHNGMQEGVAFIGLGLAVLASGYKDIEAGLAKLDEKKPQRG